MEVNNTLIITESPSKARALSKLIKKREKPTKVISCLGRLYELDPIHPDQFLSGESSISWTPIKLNNLLFIIECLQESDKILIATDPDIEGEVIAWQIHQLIEHAGKGSDSIGRVYIHEMTEESVNDSINKYQKINIGKAQAGINRRIFDNFSRFAFSDDSLAKYPFLKGAHGRVITPLLGSINDKPLQKAVIKYQRPGMPLPAYLEVNANQDIDRTIRQMDRLPAPILKKIESNREEFLKEGLDYNTLMKYATRVLKEDPSDTYQALQGLYEKGEISYFRSDSRTLSAQQQKHLKTSLEGEGAVSFSPPNSPKRERDQEGHFAITPLKPPDNPWGPIDNKGLEDKVLSLIWRYWTLHTQDRNIVRSSGDLDSNAFENKVWLQLAKEHNLIFEHKELENEKGHRSKYDNEFLPLGIKVQSEPGQNSSVLKLSQQASIISRMVDEGLSRPSTMVLHSKKVAQRFLSGHKINKKGIAAINENRRENHPLLSPATARGIESDLHQSTTEKTTTDAIVDALNKSYFKGRKSFKTERDINATKDHTIHWPQL